MKVAVLQPTYLPWVGVMALINSVDTYVFYDDVQFEAQSWQQRNRIKTANGTIWLTVPVVRNFGQKINEVLINRSTKWNKKHWESIKQSYAKAPYFDKYAWFWDDFYQAHFYYLADMTMYITKRMVEGFELKLPRIVKSSDYKLEGAKTDRLICLLKQLGATEYISGVAAKAYIEEDKFKEEGIKLEWFDYKPKVYSQIHGNFVPYLSAIDLLFNEGENSVAYI